MADNADGTAGQNPGLSSLLHKRVNPGGPRRKGGGGGQTEHATIDLSGARDGMIDTELPYDTSNASGVYSTGGGSARTYDPHYDRQETYQYAVARREDMQVDNPEAAQRIGQANRTGTKKGPGQ